MVNVELACPPLVNCTCAGAHEQVGANGGAGDTVQVNVTIPANPPVDANVNVAVADWPGVTELGVGEDGAETLKSGAIVTISERSTVNCSAPDVPAIASM
jgi:hypothetical protein